MNEIIVVACASAVCVICATLIFHRGYKDRLPRRLGLVILSLSGFIQVAVILTSYYPVRPLGVMLWLGMAFFFSSHVCSFIARFRRKDKDRTWYEDTIIVTKGRR